MKTIGTKQTKEQANDEFYERFSKKGLRKSRLKSIIRGNNWRFLITLFSLGKRVVDFSAVVFLLLILAPLFPLIFFALRKNDPKLNRAPRVGRYGEIFQQYSFNFTGNFLGRLLAKLKLAPLAVLFNVLSGDLSFVGPRAAAPEELNLRESVARRRLDARPGLLCLWWVRRRANIDYSTEFESDGEYLNSYGVANDFGIAVRAIPAIFYGGNSVAAPEKITVLGIPLRNTTMTEAVELIAGQLDSDEAKQFCFVNADCANIASKISGYKNVLNNAGYVFADGIGMKLAGKLLNTGIKQNVNGTDLFPRLCEKLSSTDKRIFLLGAKPEIAEAVRDWVRGNYPETIVCGTQDGYFSAEETPKILEKINKANTDLLLVAFGAPRQDIWIAENLSALNVRAVIGVGGLFDYFSGRIPRAPQWVREMGFEWFYRFYQEPRRMWRRYFVGNFIFLVRVAREKLSRRKL